MCLITFAWQKHPDYPLILVANRDESYTRPALPAKPWQDNPDILGGRDIQENGSWLALNKSGRFATVTNFREGLREKHPCSRGHLVQRFIQSEQTPQQFAQELEPEKMNYGGYNLLLAEAGELFYCSNRSDLATSLSAGVYSLSNHLLDSPWPKALYVKQQLTRLLKDHQINPSDLITMMKNTTPFADDLLPSTGVGIELERTLSPPFIVTEEYGTRCTTVILWGRNSSVELIEQNYLPGGQEGERYTYQLKLGQH